MKVGDLVKSDQWEVEGYVQGFRPCMAQAHPCAKMTLTLDPEDGNVRTFYHVDLFTVIPEEMNK